METLLGKLPFIERLYFHNCLISSNDYVVSLTCSIFYRLHSIAYVTGHLPTFQIFIFHISALTVEKQQCCLKPERYGTLKFRNSKKRFAGRGGGVYSWKWEGVNLTTRLIKLKRNITWERVIQKLPDNPTAQSYKIVVLTAKPVYTLLTMVSFPTGKDTENHIICSSCSD